MEYDSTTISNQMNEFISHVFALAGSLPEAAAKMYISHETIIAIVRIVPINVVAANMISCTNSQTDVGSQSALIDFLIPRVS